MLLEIKNLSIEVDRSKTSIVDGASLQINEKMIVGLVGGSGSGKTTTGLSILRLLSPQLKITSGEILLEGINLLDFEEEQMRPLRGRKVGMVFQEPLDAFNPVFSIGYQIEEVLKFHTDLTSNKRKKKILELLDMVGIFDPHRVVKTYPHQLSGGMRQRAMIAQAIAAGPKMLIADEPTSNLDVTLQARIMDLFMRLKEELSLSILLITHDLGIVEHFSNRIFVMHEGKIIESGDTKSVLGSPRKDYTQKLMNVLRG